MLQAGQGPGLAAAVGRHLEGDEPVQRDLPGQEDLAEAPLPSRRQELEIAQPGGGDAVPTQRRQRRGQAHRLLPRQGPLAAEGIPPGRRVLLPGHAVHHFHQPQPEVEVLGHLGVEGHQGGPVRRLPGLQEVEVVVGQRLQELFEVGGGGPGPGVEQLQPVHSKPPRSRSRRRRVK